MADHPPVGTSPPVLFAPVHGTLLETDGHNAVHRRSTYRHDVPVYLDVLAALVARMPRPQSLTLNHLDYIVQQVVQATPKV